MAPTLPIEILTNAEVNCKLSAECGIFLVCLKLDSLCDADEMLLSMAMISSDV